MSHQPPPHAKTLPVAAASVPEQITVDYEKATHFRVIHVDGGHGGLSPAADYLVLSVYSERKPIPQSERQKMKPTGEPDGVPDRKIRPDAEGNPIDIYREVEATLIMNLETAEGFKVWFTEQIDRFNAVRAAKDKYLAAMNPDHGTKT